LLHKNLADPLSGREGWSTRNMLGSPYISLVICSCPLTSNCPPLSRGYCIRGPRSTGGRRAYPRELAEPEHSDHQPPGHQVTGGYRVHPPTGVVLLTDPGQLDFSSWKRTVLAALADPSLQARRRFLSDRRELQHPLSLGLIEEIVDFLHQHPSELAETRWALLAKPESSVLQSLQLGEELTRGTRVRVKAFTELREALTWLLGVHEDTWIERVQDWVEGSR